MIAAPAMQRIALPGGVELACDTYDFTDPWRPAPTIVLVHGLAESGIAWYGWVPHLARRFRVVRPDLRGFGRSTPMAREFPWSLDGLAADIAALTAKLGCAPVQAMAAQASQAASGKRAAARRRCARPGAQPRCWKNAQGCRGARRAQQCVRRRRWWCRRVRAALRDRRVRQSS